jgi:hypothetical protein
VAAVAGATGDITARVMKIQNMHYDALFDQ